MYGYLGKILKINLSNREINKIPLKEEDLKKYIGGSGLATKYLYDLTGPKTDPLGEDNVLIFMTGPITGTNAFSSDRFSVVTKSPLTGIYTEADCGGKWGSALKKSGYDGIIIIGRADKPVYIWINNGKVKILDADDIWGYDTFKTHKVLKEKTNSDSEIACIGPAGENMIKYAVIATDGEHARVAGRAGCGTVMGSKRLKAIVANGNQEFEVFDPEGLKKFIKEHSKKMVSSMKVLRSYGTSNGVEYCENVGELPVKNWSQRRFDKAKNISGQTMAETILKKSYYCGKCVIGCGRTVQIEDGHFKTDGVIGGPEYETIGMLGSNLLVDDIKAIAKFNELCNKYGLDTISTGSVIGMIMECYEKGLIGSEFLDGVNLSWGDKDSIIEVIHKIGNAEGIGKLLGEGTRKIAEEIGSYAPEFAIHVKGLEAPAHEPRAKVSVALGYATSNRGACHLQAFTHDFEDGASLADMGYPETLDRFSTEGKAEFVIRFQNLMSMFDSIHCCKFVLFGGVTLKELTQTLNLVTGFEIDEKEFLHIGERLFNLKRLYNTRLGISRKDDTLPSRYLTQKRGEGSYEDKLPPLGEMLDEYYRLRKWDEIGIPKKEKIEELKLYNI